MNTYKGYVLDLRNNTAVVHTVFVRGEKYADCWKAGRARLKDAKTGNMFEDAECKTASKLPAGDELTFVKALDNRVRNVKLDKAALDAILADDNVSAEDKIKAMQAQLARAK